MGGFGCLFPGLFSDSVLDIKICSRGEFNRNYDGILWEDSWKDTLYWLYIRQQRPTYLTFGLKRRFLIIETFLSNCT